MRPLHIRDETGFYGRYLVRFVRFLKKISVAVGARKFTESPAEIPRKPLYIRVKVIFSEKLREKFVDK
jgi:hypothetical protein